MPSKNSLKVYVKDAYYHVYNRGVAKLPIFLEDQDYKVFLNYLKEALSKPSEKTFKIFTLQGQSFKGVERQPKNFLNEIELVAYCLMPNHFHLLLKQYEQKAIEIFIRSIITRYSQFFNKKYNRVGHLFQGRYKAVIITTDNYLLHLSRYIHLNPSEYTKNLNEAYSSYSRYLGLVNTSWIHPEIVLNFFKSKESQDFDNNIKTYKNFVEKYKSNSSKVLGNLVLE